MTPADLARDNAISFECKKDTLRQNQSGDWKIAFTVQGLDMDERLTKSFPGTRYMAVLVEIGTDELPVHQPKEVMPHPTKRSVSTGQDKAPPQPAEPDRHSAGAKRMDWRELQPAAQAGIRSGDPVFRKFLLEMHGWHSLDGEEAAKGIRAFCGVKSRAELGSNHKARVLWKQLDDQFSAWKHVDA